MRRMNKPKPRVQFTEQAERDIEQCRLFLWRKTGRSPTRRIEEIKREARRIARDPRLYPVEVMHPVSLLEFRRKYVEQFAIVYALLDPTEATPEGVVSIRSIRHGAREDVFWRVEEPRSDRYDSDWPTRVIRHASRNKAASAGVPPPTDAGRPAL